MTQFLGVGWGWGERVTEKVPASVGPAGDVSGVREPPGSCIPEERSI